MFSPSFTSAEVPPTLSRAVEILVLAQLLHALLQLVPLLDLAELLFTHAVTHRVHYVDLIQQSS